MERPTSFIAIAGLGLPWLTIEPPESAMALGRDLLSPVGLTDDEARWIGHVATTIKAEFPGPQHMPTLVEAINMRLTTAVERWIGEDRLRGNFPIVYASINETLSDQIDIRLRVRN